MKKYTQEEFDALPVVDGIKVCPTGDYTQINQFGARCSFGERCRFGVWCRFGEGCSFGAGCSFGEWGSFGEWCRFGERCRFGEWCSFGERCRFGEGCSFEGGHKARDGYPIMSIAGAGSKHRTTYFFHTVDGIIVRAGCFKGTLDEFRAKVLADCGGDVSSIKALQYLGFANIVAATWAPELVEHTTPPAPAPATPLTDELRRRATFNICYTDSVLVTARNEAHGITKGNT